MASYTAAEAAPLMGGPRRRATGPQPTASVGGIYPSAAESAAQSVDKRDRRSIFARIIHGCGSAGRICCASPQLDHPSSEYYEDSTNDQPWECTFGTNDNDGIWANYNDQVGTLMSSLVWILIIYSMITITLLAHNNHLPDHIAIVYQTICALSLASHSKTMFTDPGSIPQAAVPLAILFKQGITTHAMCSHCQTYKPPNSHHCRICNRCISRMDHHCPWMNNCVGAGNFKHFILFLCYTWTGCAFALIIFALNYFFCNSEECAFSPVLVQLVRLMTLLCIATLLFVSSMLMNVMYGIMTGIGTIDRLKKRANDTYFDSEEEPMALKDIFGVQGYWTWALPMDPIFEDHDRVMGYSIPQRLLRERQMQEQQGHLAGRM